MRQRLEAALILGATVSILVSLGQAQSLGDVARQTRQKQEAKDSHKQAKKVVNTPSIRRRSKPKSSRRGKPWQNKRNGSKTCRMRHAKPASAARFTIRRSGCDPRVCS